MTLTNDSLLLSLHVYGDESRAVNPDDVIGAWSAKVVSSYSSGLFAVAYRRGNDIIIAYRGSDGLGDVDDVSAAYSGDPVGQSRDAPAVFDVIATLVSTDPAYAGTQIVGLTGHSLGGGLASAIAVRENISAEVFAAVPTAVATWLSLGGNVVHSIPAARHNQGFTLQQVAEYGGVTNHALFGEIANYSGSALPIRRMDQRHSLRRDHPFRSCGHVRFGNRHSFPSDRHAWHRLSEADRTRADRG